MSITELKVEAPPYMPVSRLREAFDIISTRSFSQLSPDEFINRGFSRTDAFQTIRSLKFLGLLNEDGTKTSDLTKVQMKGEERTKGLLEIVKRAYSKLFEIAPEANKLDRENLFGDFMSIYKLSPRLATTAVPVFFWLCSQAGMEVSEEPEIRESRHAHKTSTPLIKTNRKETKVSSFVPEINNFTNTQIIPIGEFGLILPKGCSYQKAREVLADGDFKPVKDELMKLAHKLKEENEEELGGVA